MNALLNDDFAALPLAASLNLPENISMLIGLRLEHYRGIASLVLN